MRLNSNFAKSCFGTLALAVLIVVAGSATLRSAAAEAPMVQTAGGDAAQMQSDLQQILKTKRLKGVTAQVSNGVITLTGTVDDYQDKMDAEKKAHKVAHGASIQNDIQVGGPTVPDEELGQKLAGKLGIDEISPNLTQFEFFSVSVQNGIVTLNGFAVLPADKDWAIGEVATYKGVKGIVDHVQVAPPSPNDDRIRRAVAAAIYGYPVFTKYGINPEKPIRILVLNGNVTLAGVVDSQSDKETAFLRANGVGGAFKVTNDLQVEGPNER
jgi:hyperosmotically inducible protein